MSHSADVGDSVEECLVQTWGFLTGGDMCFSQSTLPIPEITGDHLGFGVLFNHPPDGNCAGVVVILSGSALVQAREIGCELCNVVSGCVTRIFPERENFDLDLPVCLTTTALGELLPQLDIFRRYDSDCGTVTILAFHAHAKFSRCEKPCHLQR